MPQLMQVLQPRGITNELTQDVFPSGRISAEAARSAIVRARRSGKQPRLQILTVEELLAGKTVDAPPMQDVRTFKKAPRVKSKAPYRQKNAFEDE